MIPLVKPQLTNKELQAVKRVFASGMLAQHKEVEAFEREFASFVGVKHAIATSNGTTALHLLLLALGIGPGDEVITTPFTFIATTNAMLYVGAKPVLVDIDETYSIDPKKIEEKITKRTKAILPVHLYGLPADMQAIRKLGRKHGLVVIEDACQAHGATINEKKTGSLSDAAVFSFYPTKNMTTGEGGMVTTNNGKIAETIRLLRNQGAKIRYFHDIVGYNFRMTDIAAAIGREQLKKLPTFTKKRQQNAAFLTMRLKKLPGIITPAIPEGFSHAFHQYTIRVTKHAKLTRKKLMEELKKAGIETGIYYPVPVHKQKAYKKLLQKERFSLAEQYTDEILSLPIHPGLSVKDRKHIIQTLIKLLA